MIVLFVCLCFGGMVTICDNFFINNFFKYFLQIYGAGVTFFEEFPSNKFTDEVLELIKQQQEVTYYYDG